MPAKLPANCYWRGGTIWGCVKVAGRRHRRSLLTADPKEARIRIKAWRTQIERDAIGIDSGHSFQEAVVKWAAEVLPKSVKPSVARRYLTSVAMLDAEFRHTPVAQIDSRSIARYISSRSAAVANTTLHRDLTALSRLLAACISWGWITENPARTHDRSIIRQRTAALVIPTDAEVERMIQAAPGPMRAVLRLLDQTGMREAEAALLEARDVDWERRQIRLSKTKTNRPRVLAWATKGGDAGLVLEPLAGVTGALFPARTGEPYANFATHYGAVARRVVAAERKAERPFRRFRVHDLRHRFAIRWLKNGGDIYRLSRHLGHTSVRTTEMYLRHLTDDEIDTIRGISPTNGATTGATPSEGRVDLIA